MKKQLLLILFIIAPFAAQSQTFSAGGGIGVNSLVINNSLEYGLSLHLYGSVSPSELFEIEARPGIFFAKNYFGIETGGYLKIFPFKDSFFFVAGLNLHWNGGEQTTSIHTREELYTLPVVGIGFKGLGFVHNALTIELAYQKPNPDGLTYDFRDGQNYYPHDFKGVIGLNLALIYQFN